MKAQPTEVPGRVDAVYPSLDMTLPESLPVSVILERKPSSNPWLEATWRASAITISDVQRNASENLQCIHSHNDVKRYLFAGLHIQLFKDECESYYHNLSAPVPRCYVIAHQESEDTAPKPFLISMSFDEAHAYLEGEDVIYDVDVPAELYRWTEAFLLKHYAPEKRCKRQRDSWKDTSRGRR